MWLTRVHTDQTLLAGLEGDPQEPALFLTTLGPKLPWFVREGIALVLKHVVGDALVARLQSVSSYKTVTELQAWQDRRNKYIQQARDEVRSLSDTKSRARFSLLTGSCCGCSCG